MAPTTRREAVFALGAVCGTAGCLGDVALDGCPSSREPMWAVSGHLWSPPAVSQNRVYVGERFSASGVDRLSRIGCYGAGTGRAFWVHPVETGTGWPRRVGSTVYVGTGDDRLFALEAATGRTQWVYDAEGSEEFGGGAWSQPAATDDRVVIAVSSSDSSDASPADPGDYTHRVVGLDAADGRVVWELSLARGVFGGPVVAEGAVYVATEAGRVHRVDPATGAVAWTASLAGAVRRQPAITRQSVVVGTESGDLVGLDPASGDSRWLVETGGAITALTAADRRVTAGTMAGRILAVDGGSTAWTTSRDAAIAAIDPTDERLWALDQRGFLAGIDPGDGQQTRELLVGPADGDRCGWRPSVRRGRGLYAEYRRAIITDRGEVAAFRLPE